MATPPRTIDPRVKRTRQLLQHAFFEIMQEKGFAAMTVQDITERATVNRGTFYAHFTDKYALLDAIIREQFQEVLVSKLVPGVKWEKSTLRLLVLAVLDFFKQIHEHCGTSETISSLIEKAAQEELTKALLTLLKQSQGRDGTSLRWPAPAEVTAIVVSGAIFGTAAEWSQQERPMPAEQMANYILAVVTEGVAPLDPALA